MFARFALTTLLAALAVVRADPNPSEPDSTTVENVGATCHIQWDVDTTGVWKEMYIELMTGDNFNMVHLTTVGMVDGTNANNATLDWTCPDVTPNSQIYFYQFRTAASTTTYWTTRFTIAAADGSTTAPTNATQPSTNDAIPWGTGAFVDPSLASAAPDLSSSSSSNSTTAATSSAAVTSAAVTTPATSTSRALTTSRSITSSANTASVSTTASSETSDASRAFASLFALGASVVALALAM